MDEPTGKTTFDSHWKGKAWRVG